MTYIPDPIELGEMRAERWADENLVDEKFRCCCGRMVPLDEGVPASDDPYAPPICTDCAGLGHVSDASTAAPKAEGTPRGGYTLAPGLRDTTTARCTCFEDEHGPDCDEDGCCGQCRGSSDQPS